MVREYGELSYAPEKFTMNFWGDYSNGYWELFERKLPGNIIIAAYEKPRTLEELSLETGVSVPYLEDEVEILENMGLLVRKGKVYQSNMILYDEQWVNTVDNKVLPRYKTTKQKLIGDGLGIQEQTEDEIMNSLLSLDENLLLTQFGLKTEEVEYYVAKIPEYNDIKPRFYIAIKPTNNSKMKHNIAINLNSFIISQHIFASIH